MISVSSLLAEGEKGSHEAVSDIEALKGRVAGGGRSHPIVVWQVTKANNLECEHCDDEAGPGRDTGELTTAESKAVIDDLAAYGVKVLELSGGEPLLRDDIEELIEYATGAGLETILSTNGTLLTDERAEALQSAGLSYAAVMVDGLPERHDEIHGREGAFDDAIAGIEAAQAVDLDVGVRFTFTDQNLADMEELVDLLALEGVERFCFDHLEYDTEDVIDLDVDHEARRRAVRRVCDITLDARERGHDIETLLAGNYADAGYVYQYAESELGADRAESVRDRLQETGGDPAGDRIAVIDYQGNVHLTEYWQEYSLGNVRDRPFSAIWEDESNPLLAKLRNRTEHLPDRCPNCNYYAMCRGGSRHRALTASDDLWAPDPQCYLTDEEVGLKDSVAD